MKIRFRCFAGLSKKYRCDFRNDTTVDLPDGATVRNILEHSGVPEEEVKTIFMNGIIVDADQHLNSGDRIALMPATGGM